MIPQDRRVARDGVSDRAECVVDPRRDLGPVDRPGRAHHEQGVEPVERWMRVMFGQHVVDQFRTSLDHRIADVTAEREPMRLQNEDPHDWVIVGTPTDHRVGAHHGVERRPRWTLA